MEAPITRALGPARIVALAVVVAAVLGLAYLHFGTGSDPVSVPSGAAAGAAEAPSVPVRHRERQLPGRLRHARRTREPAQSALAPDRSPGDTDPGPLGQAAPAPVFRLEGGPGLTNMNFPDASRFTGHHDVVRRRLPGR